MITVGITETCERLAEYPETIEGYCRAVSLIDRLIDHEHGIYYLDAPERFAEVTSLAAEFEENGLNDVADYLRTHGVAATRTWIDGEIERAREEDAALHHGEGWVLPNLEVARDRLTMED